MKIAALISLVAAERQARDVQSLLNKMIGKDIGLSRKSETQKVTSWGMLALYLNLSGMVIL